MNIAPSFITQVLNDAGQLATGALIHFYESGTDVPKPVYKDYDGQVLWSDPVICDGYGRALIYGSGLYSVMITAADGTSILDKVDGINFGDADASASYVTVLSNYAAVRALVTSPHQIYVQGRNTPGDGGQGIFSLVTSGVDDDGTTLVTSSAAVYKRVYDAYLLPEWFGVVYNNASDQYTPLMAALSSSVVTGNPLYINSSISVAQDVTIPSGASVIFGASGVLSGSSAVKLKFVAGSYLKASVGCIGANVALSLAMGCTDNVNPNWFVGSDSYKLSAANASITSLPLTTTAMSGSGWGEGQSATEWYHSFGDSTFGVLPVSNMVSAKKYTASFKVSRMSPVQYVCSNNISYTGWVGSWLTGYVHSSSNGGNTNPLTVTTKAKADSVNAYQFSVTISGMSKGFLQIVLGTTTIGTYSSNGTISQNFVFTSDNPSLTFTPSANFDGTLSGISLTRSASYLNDVTNSMTYSATGWTGDKTSFTHTYGNITPAVLTLPTALPVGSKLTGSFTVSHADTATGSELITSSGWANDANSSPATAAWTGTPDAPIYANRWYLNAQPDHQAGGDNTTRTSLASGVNPNPGTWSFAYSDFGGTKYYNKITNTLSLASVTSDYKLVVTIANQNYGAVRVKVGGWSKQYTASGTYTTIIKASGSTQISLIAEHVEVALSSDGQGASPVQKAFDGSVQLSLKAIDVGSVVLTADGSATPIVVNYDSSKLIQEDGTYTFKVTTTATSSNTLTFTPTNDFVGTISGLSYNITYPGTCEVWGGGYKIGNIVKDGTYYMDFIGSATNNNVTFRPSPSFIADISNISISESYNGMSVKLTDTYSVTGAVVLPWVDPFEGLIEYTGAGSLSVAGILNNHASKWLSFDSASYIGSISLGRSIAYPEHAGAKGTGVTDDSIGVTYAITSGNAEYNNAYLISSNIVSNTKNEFTGSGSIIIDENTSVTLGNTSIANISVTVNGSLTTGSLDLTNVVLTVSNTGLVTCGAPTISSSELNLWTGIINSGAAYIDASTVTSICTLPKLITPFVTASLIQDTTINKCCSIALTNGALVKKSVFSSPSSVALYVPSSCTAYIDDCRLETALGIASGASSTTYVRSTRTTDRVMSTSAQGSYAEDNRILHDGIGSIIVDEPDNGINPLLPRTIKNGATYNTWEFSHWGVKDLVAGKWAYDTEYYTYAGSDNRVGQGMGYSAVGSAVVGPEYWSAGVINTPNDNVARTIYYDHDSTGVPTYPEAGTIPEYTDGVGWVISRWYFGHQFGLAITPPSSGFAPGASIQLAESFRELMDSEPIYSLGHDYPEMVSYMLDTMIPVFQRSIDLPVGCTTTISVKLPFALGMAIGLFCPFQNVNTTINSIARTTPSQWIAYDRGRAGIQTALTTVNLNGCTIALNDALVLPDQYNVDNFAKPRTKYTKRQLLSTNTLSSVTNPPGYTIDNTAWGNTSTAVWNQVTPMMLENWPSSTSSSNGNNIGSWLSTGKIGTTQVTNPLPQVHYFHQSPTLGTPSGFVWTNFRFAACKDAGGNVTSTVNDIHSWATYN